MEEHFETRAGGLPRSQWHAAPVWLFLLHFTAIPVVIGYWQCLVEPPMCGFELNVTVEFWFGYASLCLGIYVYAAMRSIMGLWQQKDEQSASLHYRAFGRLVQSGTVVCAPLTIAVCVFLIATFCRPRAADIVGQGDLTGVSLSFLAVACCLLAVVLPGLATWLSLLAVRKSDAPGRAVWLVVGWSFTALYLWMLAVPALRVAGQFPLPQIYAACFVGLGLAMAAPRRGAGRWAYLSTSLSVGLCFFILAAELCCRNDSFAVVATLFGVGIATVGLIPFWMYPGRVRATWRLWYAAWGGLEGGLAFLSLAWIGSAFFGSEWLPAISYATLFNPVTLWGAGWGALWGLLRQLKRE